MQMHALNALIDYMSQDPLYEGTFRQAPRFCVDLTDLFVYSVAFE